MEVPLQLPACMQAGVSGQLRVRALNIALGMRRMRSGQPSMFKIAGNGWIAGAIRLAHRAGLAACSLQSGDRKRSGLLEACR